MSQLSLAFLGTPQVYRAGRPVTFPTRKALALLIYLAVEGGVHSREKLSTLFWPDSEPKQGRGALRKTLARLREALDDSFPNPISVHQRDEGEGSYLISEGDSLSLDFSANIDLDLHTVQTAWNLARTPAPISTGSARPSLAQLQVAIDRYRGDFLEGFSLPDAPDFDDWASVQREAWHRRIDLVFDRLSQWQAETGDVSSALDTSARWVAHHLFNETAHRRLMQLYFAEGNRTAALQAYEACRAILAKELNAKPALETEALARRIQTTALPHRLKPPSLAEIMPETPPLLVEAPLIGRAHEHVQLAVAYYASRRGHVQIVTLEGESGIGKTRLATEFLGWAAAQGADLLQGRAFETGGRLPYQPWIQALRSRVAHENAPDDLLTDVWLAELSRLLPELLDRYPDLPPPLPLAEAEARARLFEAVARLGQALAERVPLVVFIDDLQWADAASLDLLHYAAGRWAESNASVLLLLNLRSEALISPSGTQSYPDPASLASWLASLGRNLSLTRLTLNPLTSADTLQLIQALGGRGADAEQSLREASPSRRPPVGRIEENLTPAPNFEVFGRWLFAETGGQPFYVIETLKALLERNLLIARLDDEGRWVIDFAAQTDGETPLRDSLSVPPGVREVIQTRLVRLNSAALSLLAAGAVLGHDFDFESLCQVAGLSENEGLPALDELLAGHLLYEAVGEAGRSSTGAYFFSHDKIRTVVYTETSEARRRVFHRRAVQVLETAGAAAAQLAHHALAAGLPERAYHFSLAAGDEAMRLFAIRDAIIHYEQARVLATEDRRVRSLPVGPETGKDTISPPRAAGPLWASHISSLHQLYLQLGRAYELNNDFEQARTVYEALLIMARDNQQFTTECTALNRLATLAAHDSSYDLERAVALLRQALSVAESNGNQAGLTETEWNLAQISIYMADLEAAYSHGQQALTLARTLNLPELIARSLHVLAFAEGGLGKWKESEAHAEESRTLYVTLGNRAMEVNSLTLIAEAGVNTSQPQLAINAARVASVISREIENNWGRADSASHLGLALLERGEYGEALEIVQAGVTIARMIGGFAPLLILNLTVLGNIYRAMRALEPARMAHLEALAINETVPSQPFNRLLTAELCADYVMSGDWVEAHSYARQTLAARSHTLFYGELAHWYVTEALWRGGDVDLAREAVQHFGMRVGSNQRYQIPYRRCLAVLTHWEGDAVHAIAHLEETSRLAEEIGLPGEQWQILAALAELYQSRGEEARAREALGQAAKIVQALAAKIDDEGLRVGFLAAEPVRRVMKQLKVEAE